MGARLRRRTLAVVLVLAAFVRPELGAQRPAKLRLVRCAPRASLPCLTTRLSLPADAALAAAELDSAAEVHAWTGTLGAARLIGPGVEVGRSATPLRLMVLLDRSGSMAGEGIAFTRLTLRSFLEGLDSTSVRVAVAGFESRGVVAGIDSARFLPPPDAARVLDRLPAPDRAANTALYSALVAGVRRVAAAREATPGAEGAILLVTDGRNDVGHPGDDPGLLGGSAALADAARTTEAGGSRVWILGVGGNLSRDEIATLAGRHGEALTVSLDPNAMAARLAAIGRQLRPGRTLTFGAQGGGTSALARAPWLGTAALWAGGRPVVTQPLAWQPPLFALPAFEGVAPVATVPAALRDLAAGAPQAGMRWPMAALFVLGGLVLWVAAPRFAWARPPREARPAPAARAEPAAAPPADSGALRRDVQEAAPRKPGDITQEFPVFSAASTPSHRAPGK